MLSLATLLTLAQILSTLGGAGVAFDTLVERFKGIHAATPDAPLPDEHIQQIKDALAAGYAAKVSAAQGVLRSVASSLRIEALELISEPDASGELRLAADQIDIQANSLS